jgi:vesicle-associated membrane protein 7
MPIIYAIVSREDTILAEHNAAANRANIPSVVRQILTKIPTDQNMKKTYTNEGVYFDVIVEGGFIFLSVSIQDSPSRLVCYQFLEAVKNEWKTTYGAAANTATAYAMNEDFGRILARKMEFYSNDPSVDKIRAVSEQIDSVKATMVKNLDKVLERGEKIEELVDKTENLNYQANSFKTKSTQLKKHYRCKNQKITIIFVVFLLALGYTIAAFACHGPLLNSCIDAMFPGDNSTIIVNSTTTSSDTRIGTISQAVYNAVGVEYRESVWMEQQTIRNKRSVGDEVDSETSTRKEREWLQPLKSVSFKTRANVIHQLTTRLANRRKLDNDVNR